MKKNEVKKLLGFDDSIDIINIESENIGGKTIKKVFIKSNKKKVRCPRCGNFSHKIHDYLKPSKITYLKTAGEETYLIIKKRRFECKDCNKSFTEDISVVDKGKKISNKTRFSILKDLLDRDKTIDTIAREHGVSSDIVRNLLEEAMKNYPEHIEYYPEVISFDETSTMTNAGLFSFIINDPLRRVTLDILPSRRKDFLIDYFKKSKNRESVKYVICDLYKPYYEVVKICFPNAVFVADPFHYTSYVIKGLDDVRLKLLHKYEKDKNSYEYRLLKNRINKRLLLKSFNETKGEIKKREDQEEKYKKGLAKKKPKDKFNDFWYGIIKIKRNNTFVEEFRIDRLQEVLNINEELSKAYTLKEEFLRITTNVKYEDIKEELEEWIKKCKESKIPEMINAAKTIKNWLDPIVNSFKDERYTNGFTEANNNTIDKIIDRAYGYKNFDFFRLRTLAILYKGYAPVNLKNIKIKKTEKKKNS